MTDISREPGHSPVKYEKSDVDPRAIVRFAVLLVFAVIVTAVLLYPLIRVLAARERRGDPPPPALAATDPNRHPPEPRLQAQPLQDLADLRAEETATLESYAWIDRPAGIVRIPIEQAMRRTAERGLRWRAATAEPVAGDEPRADASPDSGR